MISVIVNLYNMRREAARTLYSLSTRYQRGITAHEYEVLVVENGSTQPVGEAFVREFGPQFRYVNMGTEARPSPARAVNAAARLAKGEAFGIILDGARMVTPGMLAAARDALRLGPCTLVCTLAWHLGDEHQSLSVNKGYDQEAEDALLTRIGWERDGYQLFNHASLAFSNPQGHFGLIAESCATFLNESLFHAVNGYSEEFTLPGGGYVNLDFFKRCCELDGVQALLLAGEASFHQYHGGATTGAAASEYGPKALAEYCAVRGAPYVAPELDPILFGRMRAPAMRWLQQSLQNRLS